MATRGCKEYIYVYGKKEEKINEDCVLAFLIDIYNYYVELIFLRRRMHYYMLRPLYQKSIRATKGQLDLHIYTFNLHPKEQKPRSHFENPHFVFFFGQKERQT